MFVRVRAINKYGPGLWSQEASVRDHSSGSQSAVEREEKRRRQQRERMQQRRREEATEKLHFALSRMGLRSVDALDQIQDALLTCTRLKISDDTGLYVRAKDMIVQLEARRQVEVNIAEWKYKLKW
eukprot:SAG31_NODE_11639_length_1011_cov_0.850877_2_plen_125_part_01